MPWLYSLGILISWFFSLGIPMWLGIDFLQNFDHYTPDITTPSRFFSTIGCFFVLYFLVKGSRAYFHFNIIFLLFEKTRVIFQVSMTLIKNNIIWKYLMKNVMDSHICICQSLLFAFCRIKIFKTIFTLQVHYRNYYNFIYLVIWNLFYIDTMIW